MNDSETIGPTESPPPILQVVKGNLTPEQLAALITVITTRNAAAAQAAAQAKPKARSEWGSPARQVRTPHTFGPDQWRRSAYGR